MSEETKIINIGDYRAPAHDGPCTVTFIWPDFLVPEGNAKKRFSRTWTIANGDFEGTIEAVKQNGGIYFPVDAGTLWFLPWPCAAVKIMFRS